VLSGALYLNETAANVDHTPEPKDRNLVESDVYDWLPKKLAAHNKTQKTHQRPFRSTSKRVFSEPAMSKVQVFHTLWSAC
jgi:hypothetical protein